MFVFSPLVGTPLTTSAKFAVLAKSPLTGRLTDALASMRFRNRRQADRPRCDRGEGIPARTRPRAMVDGSSAVRFVPAEDRLGLSAADAEREAPRTDGDRRGGSPRSGRRASMSFDTRRSRTTAGTPGVAPRGRDGVQVAERQSWSVPPRKWRRRTRPPFWRPRGHCACRACPLGRRQPNTASWGRWPTCCRSNAISTLPTRNFQEASFEGAEALGAEQMAELRQVTRSLCSSVLDRMRAHLQGAQGQEGADGIRERVRAWLAMPAWATPTRSSRPAASATNWGSTPSPAGGTIAWAMECVEKGLNPMRLWLRFGSGDALLRAFLREIVVREMIGDLLARGLANMPRRLVGHGVRGVRRPRQRAWSCPGY